MNPLKMIYLIRRTSYEIKTIRS